MPKIPQRPITKAKADKFADEAKAPNIRTGAPTEPVEPKAVKQVPAAKEASEPKEPKQPKEFIHTDGKTLLPVVEGVQVTGILPNGETPSMFHVSMADGTTRHVDKHLFTLKA